jgi:ribosome maturation factor RimP
MISTTFIHDLVEQKLLEGDSYLVDVTVSATNKIKIAIDNLRGVTIAECVSMSRWIASNLDREVEDFELEVSSPGMDQPFKVMKQYEKNIGKEVELKLNDGTKQTGTLISANENQIEIEQISKEKVEGKKGKQTITSNFVFPMSEVKETRKVIKF